MFPIVGCNNICIRILFNRSAQRLLWSSKLFKSKNDETTTIGVFTYNDIGPSSTKDMSYILCKTINGVPPQRAFNIVSQIQKYQDYIPYCKESIIQERDKTTNWPILACLRIGFRQYDEKFICKVECDKKNDDHYMIIADSRSDHLFDGFICQWDIVSHPSRSNSTQIKLSLKFKFKSTLYNGVASLFAGSLTSLALNSFHKRIIQCERGGMEGH